MSLVSMGEVRRAVGAVDPSRDAELMDLRDAVVEQWEQETNRLWVRRVEHEEVWRVTRADRQKIWARLFPIEEIVIEEGGLGETPVELEATDYDVENDSGRIERIGASWREKVTLTITGGYTPATTPKDIKAAILTQIAFARARHGGANIAVNSQMLTNESQVQFMAAGMHPVFKQAVERHRWRVVG